MSLIEHTQWVGGLAPPQARAVANAIEEHLLLDSLQDYRPYPKQALFHAAGGSIETGCCARETNSEKRSPALTKSPCT